MAFNREKLLIEFKRPSHTLNRDDESQAQKYRDELLKMFPNDTIKVMLVGGKKAEKIDRQNNPTNLSYNTYREIVSNARANYEWLIQHLIQTNTSLE
jgi:glucose-6-phosphate 1-dehydrogenase